ncbi:MAG TPA: phosphatidylglycerol lysyltransferase domain-containing protein [Prosthecobacter sp.]
MKPSLPSVLRLLLAILCGWVCLPAHAEDEDDDGPTPKARLQLVHGEAKVRFYEPDEIPPKAIVIFGSGDGGWSPWEDTVAHWLRDQGAYVLGFDLRDYATSDYDLKTLGTDMATLAAEAAKRSEGPNAPIIYSGWSMGAVQAVAAAGVPNRPSKLAGLLLFSADSRGRYGLRDKDELGITPEGPGTFALSEFSAAVKNLRVAQYHGGADFMASTAWVQGLRSPKALYLVPGANHGFDGPDDSFEDWVKRGLAWVLGDDSAAAAPPAQGTLPWGLSPLWPAAALAILLSLIFIFSRKHSLRILVWAITIMALSNLLEALTLKPPEVLDWMEQWLPLGLRDNSRLLLLFSGIGLLTLARGLRRHKHMAWLLAVTMLSISVIVHLTRAFDWHHSLAAAILLIPLIRWRSEFMARSDAPSLRFAFIGIPVLVLGLLIYGVTGLRQLSERGEFGEALTWADCLSGAASALVLQKSDLGMDGSRDVRLFLSNVRGGSLLGALVVLGLMLRPVLKKRIPETTPEERDTVARLITQHGGDPMDSFALQEDKLYYFNADASGFIAYALWRKYAVALADPVCAPENRAAMIAGFSTFCTRQDWEPIFYCAHVNRRPLYEDAGFVTVKVGEDARLEVADFKLEGGKFQNLRTARNKARKNGLTYQWYDATPAPDHGLEAQLQLLSQNWLEKKHGGEMTFDLGSFDIPTLRTHGASIVRNPEGRIEAFATWWPFAQGKGRCLDLMRGREEARDVMDFLIVEAIDHFKSQGVEQISLGNAPLANVAATEENAVLTREERAVKFLFDNFDRFYGYKSLFNFKKKYQPDWQGRYLAYRPRTRLAMVALAVAGVHLPGGFRGLIGS